MRSTVMIFSKTYLENFDKALRHQRGEAVNPWLVFFCGLLTIKG